jgi:hypothetical protein
MSSSRLEKPQNCDCLWGLLAFHIHTTHTTHRVKSFDSLCSDNIITMKLLVLLLTLLLLPVNGSEDVFDGGSESCDVQTFDQTFTMTFVSLPEHLDPDQITVLEEAFKTSYNGLTSCAEVLDVEILVQERRSLWWLFTKSNQNHGFYFKLASVINCRGCQVQSGLFGNDAGRRSLAQGASGAVEERSLQDSPCAPCETPNPEDFIANYNTIVLQDNANGTDVIGAAVAVTELNEWVFHSICRNFAVHARSVISFDGESTTIRGGDVGIFPGHSITGAYQFQDGGELVDDSSDFAALTVAAHATAMAHQEDETAIGIEIGGKTFTPGTYRSDSAINIAYGTVVTLDGENDSNSVFHFQAVSSLVTAKGTSFILKNGARASNVLWALGSAATLGTSSVLEGSVLAGSAITFGEKAELHGCALAQTYVTFAGEGSIKPTH